MSNADDSEEAFLKQLMAMDLRWTWLISRRKCCPKSRMTRSSEPDATRREAAQLLASGGKEEVLAWVLEWAKTREEDWRRAERLSDALREIRETRDATLQDDSSTSN